MLCNIQKKAKLPLRWYPFGKEIITHNTYLGLTKTQMDDLELEFVTVITRHGVRTPLQVGTHFQNAWDCVHNYDTTLRFSTIRVLFIFCI